MNLGDMALAVKEGNTSLSLSDSKVLVVRVFDALKADLAEGNASTIIGFGTFKPVTRTARTGRNPATGGAIQIPESNTVTFKVSKIFKDSLN